MTTSHVTIDTPTLPAPGAGAGSAAARHGKATTAGSPQGFSAMLDSLTHPSASRGTPQTKAAPTKPSSASGSRRSLPVELGAEPAELDDVEDDAPDLPAGAVPVAAAALVDLALVSGPAGTTQPPADSPISGAPADERAIGTIDDGHVTPSALVPGVDNAAPVVGVPGPETSGVETSDDAATASSAGLAPEPSETDVAARSERADSNGRPRAGWHGAVPSPSQRVKTADLVLPALASPETREAVGAAPAARLHASASVEPLTPDRQSPGAERSPLDEPAAPSRAFDAQPALAVPLAASESRTGGDWSGQGGDARGFGGSQGSRAPLTGSSSDRLSTGFVVPPSVADMASAADVVAGTPAGDTSPPQASEANLESQLVQTMRTLWRGGVGEARVTLKPEYLGAVTISLRLEGGGLQAHLQVENSQVAAWVQANESLLKSGLAGQGLTLERLVVSDDSRSRDERGRPNDRERREPRRQDRGRSGAGGFTLDV